jgi:hypothetical protein
MTETQQYTDANDILMGVGGPPALKLDQQGVEVGGRIVSKPTARQEHEFGHPENKKVFPSGDPIMGILVDVQTNQRDASIDDDDGVRRLYVEGKRLKAAVREAVQTSDAPGLEVDGELYVTFIGKADEGGTPENRPKLYQARYLSATATALHTPSFDPVRTAGSTTGPTPEQVAALKAAGIDPAKVFPNLEPPF